MERAKRIERGMPWVVKSIYRGKCGGKREYEDFVLAGTHIGIWRNSAGGMEGGAIPKSVLDLHPRSTSPVSDDSFYIHCLTAPFAASHSTYLIHTPRSFRFSVPTLPTTNNPRFARVSPTFIRRRSSRNPRWPAALFRTVEKIITSFSRPSNPSTVFTSMCPTCIARSGPNSRSSCAWYAAFALSSRLNREICAAYGAIMPISFPINIYPTKFNTFH